jgi:hypothetical protein
MANRFGGAGRDISLSNARTDVFLALLQFALSDLATEPWQLAVAQWVAWHDQNLVGAGTVGFDLDEFVWDHDAFPAQQAFLLRAVDAALAGHRWAETCYEPALLEPHLRDYRAIVAAFTPAPTPTTPSNYGWPEADELDTRCPVHRVHCSDLGRCRVCVDCGESTGPTPATG